MIVIENLEQVANQIETERGVKKDFLYAAVEQALASACRKKLGDGSQLECSLITETGQVKFYRIKEVVEDIELENTEILLKDAKKLDNKAALGDEVKQEFLPPNFGRIAAQIAKQVITQRLREAEKDSVYDEFKTKEHTITNGTVQQVENNNYLINLGRTEAILYYRDQIPGERFEPNEIIRVYITEVNKENRKNMISISRCHPGLLKCLFEIEIPEINDGIIEVMAVSREPGIRAKVAVKTNNPSIGAVGTCVGQMGGRIQAIIKELGNEKIDVLEWDEDIKKFISNALKPAVVSNVLVTDFENKEVTIVVAKDQLSLAIGKRGVNVRLSVKLTGWKLDIINEEEFEKNHKSISEKIKESGLDNSNENESSQSLGSSLAQAIADDVTKEKNIEETQRKLQEKMKSISSSEEKDMKVSDLAKFLDMKTAELIEKAAKKGIEIKSNRAILSPDQVKEIKQKVNF